MNEKRLLEIAIELGMLYHQRIEIEFSLAHENSNEGHRIIEITPAEGWSGKNAEQRDLERARALAADEILKQIQGNITKYTISKEYYSVNIATLEAERRAIEWGIRAEMVRALSGNRNDAAQPVEENGFDDAADQILTDNIQAEIQEEIPF